MKPTDRAHRANKGNHFLSQNNRSNNSSARPNNQSRSGNVSNSGPNQGNRKTGSKTASQLWADAPSQTLTSHIPTVGKKNSNGFSKRNRSQNGNDSFNGNHKNKNQNSEQSRNQRTWNNGKPQRSGMKRDNQRPQNSQRRSFSNNQTHNRNQTERNETSTSITKLDAFNLFCAYHLGIGPDNTYKSNNLNQVAQRFGVEPGVIRQAAKNFGFDPGTMLDKDFDLALAQLDIQVAPEGISKIELAKGIYDEFLKAPDLKRDWGQIIADDKKENAKVFGR